MPPRVSFAASDCSICFRFERGMPIINRNSFKFRGRGESPWILILEHYKRQNFAAGSAFLASGVYGREAEAAGRNTKCRTMQLRHESGASAKIIDAPRQHDDIYAGMMPELPLDKLPEMTNTPMVPSKFLHLKFLEIYLQELVALLPSYDIFSLVSFLDASPLQTFNLHVEQQRERLDSILDGEHTELRRITHHGHTNLQSVTITGFNSAESMIELTTHILENAPSLKHFTLDTASFSDKNCLAMGECSPIVRGGILEARRAFEAARRHAAGKVPLGVEYKFLEPCRKCHFGY
uniref:At1g61320/AtMIF1 LRR domain-containing protein n=1 Tax=Leersia perrieri TaxID=77586 RepID=A0A0D9VQI6_9ORYZ